MIIRTVGGPTSYSRFDSDTAVHQRLNVSVTNVWTNTQYKCYELDLIFSFNSLNDNDSKRVIITEANEELCS